jgi:hypothetical protein
MIRNKLAEEFFAEKRQFGLVISTESCIFAAN